MNLKAFLYIAFLAALGFIIGHQISVFERALGSFIQPTAVILLAMFAGGLLSQGYWKKKFGQ